VNDEIIIAHNGKAYTVQYLLNDDELHVYFADCQPRITMLRGLTVEAAIRPHLISYLKLNPGDTSMCEPESDMSLVEIARHFNGK